MESGLVEVVAKVRDNQGAAVDDNVVGRCTIAEAERLPCKSLVRATTRRPLIFGYDKYYDHKRCD